MLKRFNFLKKFSIQLAVLAVFAIFTLVLAPSSLSAFEGSAALNVSGDCSWSASCHVSYTSEDGYASVYLCTPSGCEVKSGWKEVSLTVNGTLPAGESGGFSCDASDVNGETQSFGPVTKSCAAAVDSGGPTCHACDAPQPSCDSGPRTTYGSDGCGTGCSITIECAAPPSCGNGSIESGEQCDSGVNNGACPRDCSNSCTINSCTATPPEPGAPPVTPPPPTPPTPPTPPVNHQPIGYVDTGNCSIIGGWAFDQDGPSYEIGIHVYRGGPAGSGVFDQSTNSSGYRPDVNAAFGISGNHGFTFTTSQGFKTGTNQSYYVYAIDSNGGPNPLIGSGIINCPLPTYLLTVSKAGNGSGSVGSIPYGISCGSACSASYDEFTNVGLYPSAAAGSTFSGWSGACSGTGDCTVLMSEAKNVTASFALNNYTLSVSKIGSGTVTSDDGGIACGSTCSASYVDQTYVTVRGTPAAGYYQSAWTGACAGSDPSLGCTVHMNQARSVGATFTLTGQTLTVSKAGTGTGTVTSSPAGINCGSTCAASYEYGQTVTLSGTPATGSTLTGWSGSGCSGTGSCTVTMTEARNVTATFSGNNYTLTVAKTGTGTGTITSNPAGINCGATCSALFAHGQGVTLTPDPTGNSTFTNWSGSCTGGSCSLTMYANEGVTGIFTLIPFNYSLSNSGTSNVTKGGYNAYTQNVITKTLVSGTSESVTLTLSGVPSGVSYSLASGTCAPTCTTTITFTVAPSATVGTHLITVTGSPLSKTTSFNLVIAAAPTINVSCVPSSTTVSVGQSVTWTGSYSGGTAPYTLVWSGTNIPTNPAPTGNTYTITYTTSGIKVTTMTATDVNGVEGSCSSGGSGGGGGGGSGSGGGVEIWVDFDPRFQEF